MSNSIINEVNAMENVFGAMVNEVSTTEKENAMEKVMSLTNNIMTEENAMMNNEYAQRIMNASSFKEFDADAREKMHEEFIYVLQNWGDWNYDSDVLYDILDTWFLRKRELIAQMSFHPNFDKKNFCIRLDNTTYKRDIDWCLIRIFTDFIYNAKLEKRDELYTEYNQNAKEFFRCEWRYSFKEIRDLIILASEEQRRELVAYEILYNIACVAKQYITDEDVERKTVGRSSYYLLNDVAKEVDLLKEWFNIRVSVGQKRTKVVRQIANKIGLTSKMGVESIWNRETHQYEDKEINLWNKRYAEYCDAINPLDIPAITFISANFIDYMLQSNGDSWSSCHNINKETYSGCNCSGSMSYALDERSLQMHTYLPEKVKEVNNIKFAGKRKRVIIHMGHDFNYFVFSCVYENRTEEEREQLLPIFEKVWADCLGVPNLWQSEVSSSLVTAGNGCTAYHDWAQEYCKGKTVRVKDYDKANMKNIYAGASPICVECGREHDECDTISCCSGKYTCEHCGETWDEDYYLHYSEINGEYVCENCATYCEYEDDWEYNGYVTYVESVDSYVSENCLENEFYYCEECGEYFLYDDVTETRNGDFVCNHCLEYSGRYVFCDDCGELIDTEREEVFETEDGMRYCEDCAPDHESDDHWEEMETENEEIA